MSDLGSNLDLAAVETTYALYMSESSQCDHAVTTALSYVPYVDNDDCFVYGGGPSASSTTCGAVLPGAPSVDAKRMCCCGPSASDCPVAMTLPPTSSSQADDNDKLVFDEAREVADDDSYLCILEEAISIASFYSSNKFFSKLVLLNADPMGVSTHNAYDESVKVLTSGLSAFLSSKLNCARYSCVVREYNFNDICEFACVEDSSISYLPVFHDCLKRFAPGSRKGKCVRKTKDSNYFTLNIAEFYPPPAEDAQENFAIIPERKERDDGSFVTTTSSDSGMLCVVSRRRNNETFYQICPKATTPTACILNNHTIQVAVAMFALALATPIAAYLYLDWNPPSARPINESRLRVGANVVGKTPPDRRIIQMTIIIAVQCTFHLNSWLLVVAHPTGGWAPFFVLNGVLFWANIFFPLFVFAAAHYVRTKRWKVSILPARSRSLAAPHLRRPADEDEEGVVRAHKISDVDGLDLSKIPTADAPQYGAEVAGKKNIVSRVGVKAAEQVSRGVGAAANKVSFKRAPRADERAPELDDDDV